MTSLLDALWTVETNRQPGRVGPKTRWGRPLGIGQTLPDTAREMAQKLGLQWRQDLLTATTPEGEEYQKAVSSAYFNEGMERTGNTRDALRYYHGGPNRKLWGPKTNAYADKVLALAGNEQPMQSRFPPVPGRGDPLAPLQDAPPMVGMNENPRGLASILQQPQQPQPNFGAMSQVIPGERDPLAPKPKSKTGSVILGIIADAIAGGFGRQGGFAPAFLNQQQEEGERNERLELWRQQQAEKREERMRPQFKELGDGRFGFINPGTGEVQITATLPQAPVQTDEAKDLAWWNNLPDDQKAAFLGMKDAVSPVTAIDPRTGAATRVPRQLPVNGGYRLGPNGELMKWVDD